MAVFLHIGASKCGSSALQSALSKVPLVCSQPRRVEYAVIRSTGKIARGAPLTASAAQSPYNYAASLSAAKMTPATLQTFRTNLQNILEEVDDVIFSNEGWLTAGRALSNRGFTDQFPVPSEVICYVRPQVEYLNSAWWQWGAWRFNSFEEFLAVHIQRSMWHKHLSFWRTLPNISKISCRPLPADIVQDFIQIFGMPHAANELVGRINATLPAVVLRLFQKYPQLRVGSATGFTLAQYIDFEAEPIPWVIDQSTARHVIERCYEGNLRLLKLLDPHLAEQVKCDQRWWDAAAFADKEVQPPEYSEDTIHKEDLSRLCRVLIETVSRFNGTGQRKVTR